MNSEDIRIFTGGKRVIIIGEEYYNVELYLPDLEYLVGTGYIKGNLVYIYHGDLPTDEILHPGFYKTSTGYKFVKPSKMDDEKYRVSKIMDLNLDAIFGEIKDNKDRFIAPEDVEILNNNTEAFIPTMKEEDDFLKYLIKKAITDKQINLKNYKDRFNNQYALNNMKSTLNKSTKMTVTNFKIWCEVLGLKWNIVLSDSGADPLNPLPKDIIINSNEF